MKKTALLIIVALLMSGCMTEKRQNRLRELLCHGNTTNTNDSTAITEHIITETDSTYYFTAEALYKALFACDSTGNIYLLKYDSIYKTNRAIKTDIKLDGNTVYINSKVDSGAVFAKYFKDHKTTTIKVKNDKKEVTPPVYIEKPFGWWTKTCRIGFPILASFIILYILFRIFRKKLTLTVNPFG